MKLNISISKIKSEFQNIKIFGNQDLKIDSVIYDSRRIIETKNVAFLACRGSFTNGHEFVLDAFEKGVRCFIIEEKRAEYPENATYIHVDDVLHFLQKLASYHRRKFKVPVIAITGSFGKTTVKEWIYHLLKNKLRIVRSPKSYNSQLGVALSLLEINDDAQLVIIEAAISKPSEMAKLESMIQPTHGVLTNIKKNKKFNFSSKEHLIEEYLLLFKGVNNTIVGASDLLNEDRLKKINGIKIYLDEQLTQFIPFKNETSLSSAKTAICASSLFSKIDPKAVESLPNLANRMETFEGINNLTFINDCYNFDLEALKISIDYAKSISIKRKLYLLIGQIPEKVSIKKIKGVLENYPEIELIFWDDIKTKTPFFSNATILIKGYNTTPLQKWLKSLKFKSHKTFIEYNLTSLRKNLGYFRDKLNAETKILCMVKAQSYGSGIEKLGQFLEKCGVDMLGVAYSDEGVELRKAGVKVPILVMNPNADSFDTIIENNLTPAIYNTNDLDILITELLNRNILSFPIHVKLETGMNRLGICEEGLKDLIEMIQAQPEVYISGVYSHLSDADNLNDSSYSYLQVNRFLKMVEILNNNLPSKKITHVLNTQGIINLSEFQFDMVRIGIGLFGITGNSPIDKELHPVIEWKSEISQIKHLKKGECIGYGKSFVADKSLIIGVVPVGYADGFRRSLGEGRGGVYVHDTYCQTVGRVCMDMIMIDLSQLDDVQKGDYVEIIGRNQSVEEFAEKLNTIPYEVMTSFSKRVPRVYIED